MFYVAQFAGAVLAIALYSRFAGWLLRKLAPSAARLWSALAADVAAYVFCVCYWALFRADGGPPGFLAGAQIYTIPLLLCLAVDAAFAMRRKSP